VFDIFNIDESRYVTEATSYQKLIKYINGMHPRDNTKKKFPCCTSLGTFPGIFGQFNEEMTVISQQFQIGPTMFLMTLKQLMWVFFFLSIINIPLYTFYW